MNSPVLSFCQTMPCCGRFRSRSVEDAGRRRGVRSELLRQASLTGVRETRQYLREFSDVTTLHGIRYVGEKNRHPLERLCWVVAIAVSAVLCGVEMAKLWSRWQTSPVIVSLATRSTSFSSLPFPAVTVCPENRVRRSVLDMTSAALDNMRFQLNGSRPFKSSEDQLNAEAASLVCNSESLRSLLPSTFVRNSSHLEALKKISPTFEDVFETCRFRGVPLGCSKIFRPILTELGICFSFNIQGDHELFSSQLDTKPVEPDPEKLYARNSTWDIEKGYSDEIDEYPWRSGVDLGPIFGLRVVLKSRDDDVQKTCSTGDPATFKVIVHAPMEFPDTYGNFLHAVPDSESLVGVRPSTFTTAPELRAYKPSMRGCNYPEDHEMKIFRTYTKTNCYLGDCFIKTVKTYCGCQPWTLPLSKTDNMTHCSRSLVECGADYRAAMDNITENNIQTQLRSDEVVSFCGCLPGCNELKYIFHANNVRYEHQQENATQGLKFAKLTVFVEETTFYGNHRSELYGLTDLIANYGGLLGLFSGFSFISAVEVIYFASLRLVCHLRDRKKTDSNK